MSNKRKNRRRKSKRTLKAAKPPKKQSSELNLEEFTPKEEKENEINKRFLILCEGETEQAYFSGLKNNILLREKFRAVQIEIIAPSHKKNPDQNTTLIDNSLKGLVWEAMQRKREADREKNPYDEIWIVIDNDERNSYIISNGTLIRAGKILTHKQIIHLTSHLDAFFLSDRHYLDFLKNEIGLAQQTAEVILRQTDKHRHFEEYEAADPKKQFYTGHLFTYGQSRKQNIPKKKDFDNTWKNWLQKAYSCRSFEHWLILHFESCKIPFTISNEEDISAEAPKNPNNSIHHLWTFAPDYSKGYETNKTGKLNAYEILKPQPFNPKYETEAEAQAVIDKVNTAILNSFWLRKEMETELALQGGRYYEVNPYTNTNYLISSLLEKQITIGNFGNPIDFDKVNIAIQLNQSTREVQVTLTNLSSTKRILINNTNKGNFFKILTINNNHLHTSYFPESISNTVNIPPGDLAPTTCSLHFTQLPDNNKSYLVFKNDNQNHFLYFPIQYSFMHKRGCKS